MNNAEWIIKTGHTFKQLRLIQHNELSNRTYTVMLCDEQIAELKDKKEPLDVFRKWLDSEHIEPILDDAEREYLSAVIKPFMERVWYIRKAVADDTSVYKCSYYILIRFNDGGNDMNFPVFHEPDMYKGMKFGKTYTPKELGL